MTMTMIAHICLLVAALAALCAMLLCDLTALRREGYSNNRFYSWLLESGELTAPKRLTALAVLVGCFTTMARTSWMVVMILAAVLAVLAVVLLMRRDDTKRLGGRSTRVFIQAMTAAILIVGAGAWVPRMLGETEADVSEPAALLAVMLVAVSPLLTMCANWLMPGKGKKAE